MVLAIKDNDLFQVFTNYPNTTELVVSWDVPFDPEANPFFGGVKGCLDKVTINRISAGMYIFSFHDVWETTPYLQSVPHPILINYPKPYVPNTMKIQHIQVSIANHLTDVSNNIDSNYYAYVWYWNPDEFPVEMATAHPSIQNSVVVTIFNATTNDREDPSGLRGHMILTLMSTFENVRLLPEGAYRV